MDSMDGTTDAGFCLVVSGVPEHVRKKQKAERKFQEAGQQRRSQEIANLLAEMRAQNQESWQHAKARKFPQFDGDDPEKWCGRAEQYFEFYGTPDEHRFFFCFLYMEGNVLQWINEIRASNCVPNWKEFVRAFQARFSVPKEVENQENFKHIEEQTRDKIPPETDPNESPK
jgi:hypothetical protein